VQGAFGVTNEILTSEIDFAGDHNVVRILLDQLELVHLVCDHRSVGTQNRQKLILWSNPLDNLPIYMLPNCVVEVILRLGID